MPNDTIAAIATPGGTAGVGIIKISGPLSMRIAEILFRKSVLAGPRWNRDADQAGRVPFQPQRLHHGFIIDPDHQGVIDEVLLAVMRAPHSYTREDVIEIQAHSGPLVLKNLLKLVLEHGARLAQPGEFTRRAFMNGRLDLTRVEAVIDLIHARSDEAHRAAANQLSGKMTKRLQEIKEVLSGMLAGIEARIDFPEDLDDSDDRPDARLLEEMALEPVVKLIQRYDEGHLYRDGLNIVIVGRPNVGKSSLMNRLVGKELAIVTHFPGTTRDLVRDQLSIKGIPVNIIDTAGLHTTTNPIENAGIQKTRESLEEANLVLLVVNAAEPLTGEDFRIYEETEGKQRIVVINKIDLTADGQGPLPFLPETWKGSPRIRVSALFNTHIEALKESIGDTLVDRTINRNGDCIIPNLRHLQSLEKTAGAIRMAMEALRSQRDPELVSIDLHEAIEGIDDILGIRTDPDVLDRIFEQFCIGK